MKIVRGAVFGLVLSVVVGAQTATPDQSLAWDYLDSDVSDYLVTRFEANYDGTGYVDAGLNAHPIQPDVYYMPLPALVSGPHSVVVRACNANGCSADSDPPLAFSMVAGVPIVIQGGSVVIIQTP